MTSLEQVLTEVQKNKRVCLQPQRWQQLFDMLPDKKRSGTGWEPSLPLILATWSDTPAMSKMLRLREHIEWAASHGSLEKVGLFLSELQEDQWHHIGE